MMKVLRLEVLTSKQTHYQCRRFNEFPAAGLQDEDQQAFLFLGGIFINQQLITSPSRLEEYYLTVPCLVG
jgi:hypothetical protein